MNLIFDLDGTLVDSATGVLSALHHVIVEHQIPHGNELTSELIGPPLRDIVTQLVGNRPDEVIINAMIDTFKRYYDEKGVYKTLVYEGVTQMLRELKNQGHSLYIATNKRMEPTQALMEYFSWGDYFFGVYSLDSFNPVLKDKASLLRKVINTQSLVLADTIYIGDRPEDREAAIQSNLKFLHASWGYGGMTFDPSRQALLNPAEIYHYVN